MEQLSAGPPACLHGSGLYTAIIYWSSSALEPLLPFICSPSLGASIHTHVINQMLVTSKLLSSPFVYLSIWHHHEMFWRHLKPKHTPQTWTTFWVCFSVNGTTPTIYLVPLLKIWESFLTPPLPCVPVVHNYVLLVLTSKIPLSSPLQIHCRYPSSDYSSLSQIFTKPSQTLYMYSIPL